MPDPILVVDDNQELLSLLRQLLEDAGHQVLPAAKGKAALEACVGQKPAAALLDILLPDMTGFQLAERLRKEQPNLPLIFITGVFKGGKHALEARNKFGAAAYFEKPFEAAKLLEAIQKIAPAARPPPPPEDDIEMELEAEVEEDQPQDAMELTGKIKVTGNDNLTAEIRGANLTAAAAKPAAPKPAAVHAKPAGAKPTATVHRSGRQGELKDNLPSLITAFYLSKETGELSVQRDKVKKVIYFERGTPVFALSNLQSDRFGQFLVRTGKLKQEQLADVAAIAKQTNRRTGDVLIEKGLLKDTERLYYVGQQVKAIIYSLFSWEEGSYAMSFRDRATKESIKLDVHPANLILRGIKKLYKPERLKRLVKPEERFMPSLQPAYALDEIELEKWEAELLPTLDGGRTNAELLVAVGRPEHVVNAFLHSMRALNVLEPKAEE